MKIPEGGKTADMKDVRSSPPTSSTNERILACSVIDVPTGYYLAQIKSNACKLPPVATMPSWVTCIGPQQPKPVHVHGSSLGK